MRKRSLWIFIAVLAALALLAVLVFTQREPERPLVTEANQTNFSQLLSDLVAARETPSAEDEQTIARDLEAIRAIDREDYVLAQAVAGHWQKVYLDPAYELYLYHGDDTTPELAGAGIPNKSTHAIVVLGYELSNGEMQPELVGRCEAAAAMAKAYPETILVCSGGATGGNNPEKHTEAGMMKAYLTDACGIDGSRVFIDERAMTTAENAVNTMEILRQNGVHTMTIVTSTYHQRWGQALYNLVAALYRRQHGYAVDIVANYNYDTAPSEAAYYNDAQIAAQQMAGILGLPHGARRP